MKENQERVIVFIDGNNLYHRMKGAGITTNGLDFSQLSKNLLEDLPFSCELIETRYYTGQVKQTQTESSKKLYQKQRSFLNGLKWQDKISVHLGRLEEKVEGNKKKWVEKAVDVMIAVDMVSMAYENTYDVAYLLSADGDFTPAVKEVRARGHKVFSASPGPSYELKLVTNDSRRLGGEFFNTCRLTAVES